MKKVVLMLLAIVLALPLSACGANKEAKAQAQAKENAKTTAKEAYDLLVEAYNKTDEIGSSIYGVWAENVGGKQKILEDPLGTLLPKTKLTEDELKLGLVCAGVSTSLGSGETKEDTISTIKNGTEDEINKLLTATSNEVLSKLFLIASDMSALAVNGVVDAYYINGGMDTAQDALNSAKEKIKEAEGLDADVGGLEALKNIYVTTSSYLNFCQNVTGSVLQTSDTLTQYRTSVKHSMAELELVF